MIPVDLTAGPFNCAFGVAGLAGWPEGHLQSGRGLGELVLIGGCVKGFGLLQGALNLAVDLPLDGFRGPVKLIGVPIAESIFAVNLGFTTIVV